jgi:hypothetical protein
VRAAIIQRWGNTTESKPIAGMDMSLAKRTLVFGKTRECAKHAVRRKLGFLK